MIRATPVLFFLRGQKGTTFQFEQVFLFPLAILTKVLLRQKVIVDDFNLLHPDYHFMPRFILKTLDWLAILSSDVIATASPLSMKYISTNFPNKRVHYVPNGITPAEDTDSNHPADTEQVHPIAVFVGGLVFHQNLAAVTNIMRLADILSKLQTPLSIEIVGGPLSRVEYLRRLNVVRNGSVRLRGPINREELESTYRRTTIGLLPFFSDTPLVGGQRTKALEYLNHGLLVVSGPEGIGELSGLKPSVHYLLSDSLHSFAYTLDIAARHPERFSGVRSEGKKAVRHVYAWDNVLQPLIHEIAGP